MAKKVDFSDSMKFAREYTGRWADEDPDPLDPAQTGREAMRDALRQSLYRHGESDHLAMTMRYYNDTFSKNDGFFKAMQAMLDFGCTGLFRGELLGFLKWYYGVIRRGRRDSLGHTREREAKYIVEALGYVFGWQYQRHPWVKEQRRNTADEVHFTPDAYALFLAIQELFAVMERDRARETFAYP